MANSSGREETPKDISLETQLEDGRELHDIWERYDEIRPNSLGIQRSTLLWSLTSKVKYYSKGEGPLVKQTL